MCNISHSISRVFLAQFPEEMRPTAAACPPLLQAARSEGRQGLRQPSRRRSPLREGESLATTHLPGLATSTPHTPHQPPRARHHVLPNVGGFWEEGRRSTARGTQFYRRRIAFALKPESLWAKLSEVLIQMHAPYGETISPASCSPPSRSRRVLTTCRHLYGLWVTRHPP